MSWKIDVASAVIHPRLALQPWTIQLKSSHPPTYDHWYLDDHFPLVIWQCGVIAAGRGGMWKKVRHVNQMAWHLNTLPSDMPGLKNIELDG